MRRALPVRSRLAGFTLLEVLVALAIVSAVAVLSWQGLDNVIRLTRRVQTLDDQWEQMRVAFAQLEADFKSVSNPRGAQAPAVQGGTPAGSAGGSNSESDRLAMLRAGDRPDVTVEDDQALDTVVDNLLSTLRKVEIQGNTLSLLVQSSNRRDGPVAQSIRWRVDNGRLRRELLSLSPTGADSATRTGLPSLAPATVFDEPGLTVRGVGIRLWIEGRGWDAEQNLGEPLPVADVFTPPPDPNAPGNAGQGPAQALRFKGAWVRVWLPSGEIYSRVFMLGQAS